VGFGGGPWTFDLSWSQAFALGGDLRSSVSQVSIDPLSEQVGRGFIVGDGRLSSVTQSLGLALRWER
jgi:hypothetical protein